MDDIEWTIANEGQLLDAMVGHKPVGVNKYFQMAFICEKFNNNINKDVDPDKIWAHLETMYNLEALDENESIPFPNNEKEFALPEDDFASLISKKEEERKSLQKGRDTPKLIKEKKEVKDDKTPVRNMKDTPRRDSTSSTKDRESPRSTVSTKKEIKKDSEKAKSATKNRNSNSISKDDPKTKSKIDETPKTTKRPLRGNLKTEDGGSNGKSSPIPNTPGSAKRRRIL